MTNKEIALNEVSDLIQRFEEQKESYKSRDYNETQTRREFIDPFFKALGWDIDNKAGYAEAYKEVIHEDRIRIDERVKAPDYSFRMVGGKRLFFVEAKKPSVIVKEDILPAYQLRSYGFSAKLPISIITDFEEFAIYDCTKKPYPNDKASVARIKYLTYKDYIKEFDFIWDTFSRERVPKGSLDTFIKGAANKKGTSDLDKAFLESLDNWRTLLAQNFSKNNKNLNEDEINFVVQQTIDRIIFLRIAEDRGIEPYGNLQSALVSGDYYKKLFGIFKEADDKYNSGLFDFKKDTLSKALTVENKIVKTIINQLYYPECPYQFSVFPVEILGNVYEQFLGKVIRLSKTHQAKVEEKPEVRKAGGVYYTPQYIVEYIVKNTVGKLIDGKKPKEIEKIKVVDPACGSGSFLLGAYKYLLDYHQDYYSNSGKPSGGKKDNALTPEGNLTTAVKKKILLNNIFGVDIDANAVEVTKLSLLLKCMENETASSISNQLKMFHERVLPDLDSNIKSGNSLIDTDFYDTQLDFGEDKKIKPFNWQKGFPDAFKQGGFDCVIGNPPYVRIHELNEESKNYYRLNYKSASNQFDLYQLFYEQGINILNKNGLLGFITSNKFCITNYGKTLRQILFKNTCIKQIVDCSKSNVFGNVSTYPFIFVISKDYQKNNTTILIEDFFNDFKVVSKKLQDKLLIGRDEIFNFNNEEDKLLLIDKIESKKTDDVFTVYRGRGTSKDLSEIGKIASITNKEIKRYGLFKNVLFRNEKKYENDFDAKILMKKVCYNIECSVDLKGEINPINTVYVIKPIAKNMSICFLLAMFNSKLMSYYARQKYLSTAMRGGYIELRVFEVSDLPVISPKLKEQNLIISLVNQLLDLNKELSLAKLSSKLNQIQSHIDHLEERINHLVYQLYELTPEEIDIVEGRDAHALGAGNQIYLVKDESSNEIDIDSISFSVRRSILPFKSESYYLDTINPWLIVGDGHTRNPTQKEWKKLYNILKSGLSFTRFANPTINDGTTIDIDISINDAAIEQSGIPEEGAQKILEWIKSIKPVY